MKNPMWFMNKLVNPLMSLILRSPLHGMLSAALLLFTYRGQKSGKTYTLPVQYAQNGQAIFIVPGMPEKKTWWRNLRAEQPVRVTLRGKTLPGMGRLLDCASDAADILAGLELYGKRFPAFAKANQIRLEADGSFNAVDLRRVAASVVIVRVDLDHTPSGQRPG